MNTTIMLKIKHGETHVFTDVVSMRSFLMDGSEVLTIARKTADKHPACIWPLDQMCSLESDGPVCILRGSDLGDKPAGGLP